MDINRLCMGCMREKNNTSVCRYCGYSGSEFSPLYLKPASVLSGKYVVGKILGHGGFGITYIGIDLNLNYRVAIKEFIPRIYASRSHGSALTIFSQSKVKFEQGMEKFLDEARTLARFSNINGIVGVKDFFKENNTAYIVMDYLEGSDLASYAKALNRRLTYDEVTTLLSPVFDSLDQVHKEGLLHRDISPDNIFITTNNLPILIDFGAARQFVNQKSRLSVILKPGYAPIEQYGSRRKQGPYTDIYAFAATIYHLMAGRMPPESLSRMEDDTIIPPSRLGVLISTSAEKALLKALALKGSNRYQSMQDFKRAFVLNNSPMVLARNNKQKQISNKNFIKKVRLNSRELRSNAGKKGADSLPIPAPSKQTPNARPRSVLLNDFASTMKEGTRNLSIMIDNLAPDESAQSKILVRILVFAGVFIVLLLFILIIIALS
jgi:serine/threonine protein kinase